jgi:hypothetical protein
MFRRVLLVDPQAQPDWISGLRDTVRDVAVLTVVDSYHAALNHLNSAPPDVLFTNVRLAAYNGIHLAWMAAPIGVRTIVYAEEHDALLAREAQEAGAFYTRLTDLRESFRDLIAEALPDRDRRDASVPDRRHIRRGGRRSNDLPAGDS